MTDRGKTADVLAGRARFAAICGPWEQVLPTLPDDSVDLLVTSGPYEAARTYGIEFGLSGQEWVDWMVSFVRAAAPKVKGLIALNCEGQTRDYSYSGVPYLLFADLKRAGFNMRRPVVFHRVGIPGSGGPDWLRGDTELVICVTRPGKLPFSDNTACGHPPKWAPGGEVSYRTVSGGRVNQWGMRMGNESSTATRNRDGTKGKSGRPSHVQAAAADDPHPQLFDARPVESKPLKNAFGVMTDRSVGARTYGDKGKVKREGEKYRAKGHASKGGPNGDIQNGDGYDPPTLANPGNVVQRLYTADEVAALLAAAGNVLHATVGGGCMGHPAAHDNEAPFPLELPTFFIKSFCPPDGVVLDPFCGSGTTLDAAVQCGRRAIGCDVRQSQVDLTRRRMRTVTAALPGTT